MPLNDNPAAPEVQASRGWEMTPHNRHDAQSVAPDKDGADQPTEDDFNPDETDADTNDDFDVDDVSRPR